MWQVNEVLKFDDQLYRILAIELGTIYWIQVDSKNALPEICQTE